MTMQNNENPIIDSVFQKLLEAPNWKLNDLSSALQSDFAELNFKGSFEEQLFQRNFLLMNALFTLQDDLIEQRLYLKIESINISLCEQSNTPTHASNTLKTYYLDWQNATESHQAVCDLLDNFWQAYTHEPACLNISETEINAALEQLSLDSEATLIDVKKRWRKLALAHHPDRNNGNKASFQQLENAYNLLLRHFKQR